MRCVLFLVLAGALSHSAPAGASVQEESYAIAAEGLTSAGEQRGIKAAYRMWALPDFDAVCAAAPKPSTLDARQPAVALKVGERFPLTRLVIIARDAAGRALAPVPIAIEVEAVDPPLLNLRSDARAEGKLQVLRRGSFRFRVRTTCEGVSVSTLIPATIK